MGCAKFATNSTYTVTGTPDYFAPEMVKAGPFATIRATWTIICRAAVVPVLQIFAVADSL